jgi:hypothetical protein
MKIIPQIGDRSLRKQGTITQTVAIPISITSPKARSAGVWLKLSKPKESSVLNADRPTESDTRAKKYRSRRQSPGPATAPIYETIADAAPPCPAARA